MKQVILITGASSGIGKATVYELLNAGHIVYGVSRRMEEMRDIERAGANILSMDVTDSNRIKEVVNQIIDRNGRIDVLINNAGYGEMGAVEDVSIERARHQFDVNLFGLAELTKYVLPFMRKQGKGRIINTASMGGKIYTPLSAWYIASKHALEGWSDCLRLELYKHNIDVVIIEPGIIKTSFFDDFEEKMIHQAKDGAYKDETKQTVKLVEEQNNKRLTSSPLVVAKTIARAVKAKRPRTRYITGYMAHFGLIGRRLVSDRIYDRVLLFAMKRTKI